MRAPSRRRRILLFRGLFEAVVVAAFAPLMPGVSFWGGIAGFLAVFGVALILPPPFRRALPLVGGAVGAGCALLGPSVYGTAGAGLYAGWRSAQVARMGDAPDDAEASFTLGLSVFTAGSIVQAVGHLASGALLGGESVTLVLLGFASVLVAREAELARRSRLGPGMADRSPFLRVGGAYLGVLTALSGAAALILSPSAAVSALDAVGTATLWALGPVIHLLGAVAQILTGVVRWFLLDLLGVHFRKNPYRGVPHQPHPSTLGTEGAAHDLMAAAAVLGAIVVVLILWGLWRLLAASRTVGDDEVLFTEERERLTSGSRRVRRAPPAVWPYSEAVGEIRTGVQALLRALGTNEWKPEAQETLRNWSGRTVGGRWEDLLNAYEAVRYGDGPDPAGTGRLLEEARREGETLRAEGSGAVRVQEGPEIPCASGRRRRNG